MYKKNTINTALGWEGPPHERKRAVLTARTTKTGTRSAPGATEKRRASRAGLAIYTAQPRKRGPVTRRLAPRAPECVIAKAARRRPSALAAEGAEDTAGAPPGRQRRRAAAGPRAPGRGQRTPLPK